MNIKKLSVPALTAAALLMTACEKKVVVQNHDATAPQSQVQPGDTISATQNPTAENQDLPAGIKTFVAQHYPNINMASYEIKNLPGIGKKFEVKMNNGAEIDFDKDGNWEEISDGQGVPEALIPNAIKTYVSRNYKGIKVKSIDKEKNKTKVDLLNGTDLEFDANGKFLRVDP